jgi:hypothetical protein
MAGRAGAGRAASSYGAAGRRLRAGGASRCFSSTTASPDWITARRISDRLASCHSVEKPGIRASSLATISGERRTATWKEGMSRTVPARTETSTMLLDPERREPAVKRPARHLKLLRRILPVPVRLLQRGEDPLLFFCLSLCERGRGGSGGRCRCASGSPSTGRSDRGLGQGRASSRRLGLGAGRRGALVGRHRRGSWSRDGCGRWCWGGARPGGSGGGRGLRERELIRRRGWRGLANGWSTRCRRDGSGGLGTGSRLTGRPPLKLDDPGLDGAEPLFLASDPGVEVKEPGLEIGEEGEGVRVGHGRVPPWWPM